MKSESGQAAVEWVGLVLVATLVLGALGAFVPAADGEGHALGHDLAGAIVCAARGSCEARGPAGAVVAPVSKRLAAGGRPTGVVSRGTPPPARPVVRPLTRPDRVAAALHVLNGVKHVARRAWVACLGWERYRYEMRHPEAAIPGNRMPVRDALRIAHVCLNPVAFLGEGEEP